MGFVVEWIWVGKNGNIFLTQFGPITTQQRPVENSFFFSFFSHPSLHVHFSIFFTNWIRDFKLSFYLHPARLLDSITRNFEYSKMNPNIRVSGTICSTMESLIATSFCVLCWQMLLHICKIIWPEIDSIK